MWFCRGVCIWNVGFLKIILSIDKWPDKPCIEEICCADEEVLGINDTLYYLNKLEDAFKIDPTLLKDFMDLQLSLLDTFKDRRHHR